ncbi:hypothetical protein ANN_21379 [Periplaneta americana]|uniref:Uncharacterized protein n=1 Tax=Periplaneta americana TaxID=6978 RepID=A0ABQ8SGB2_PERAM|nr:hypothetical protein ANN_21379 [Periplaneta americana]
MAGLCEGGSEPPGSVKASVVFVHKVSGLLRCRVNCGSAPKFLPRGYVIMSFVVGGSAKQRELSTGLMILIKKDDSQVPELSCYRIRMNTRQQDKRITRDRHPLHLFAAN